MLIGLGSIALLVVAAALPGASTLIETMRGLQSQPGKQEPKSTFE